MTRTLTAALAAACVLASVAAVSAPAVAASRIKDIANIEGVRQNQLIGYGLVVGLNGTGDTLNNIPFTKQSLQAMLERMGVNIRGAQIRTGNVAAVMVTANLPPFGTQGTRIDVTVSALGDAKSLHGRHAAGHAAARRRRQRLCSRPGLGRDRRASQAQGDSRQYHARRADGRTHLQRRHHRARDRVRAQPAQPGRLALRNADFTTAKRIAAAVNDFLGGADRGAARPLDRAGHAAGEIPRQRRRAADRDRAVADRARPRRPR